MLWKLALSGFGLLAAAGAATAADLPTMKGPAPSPVFAAPFSWTGFYVGGNVGGAWTRDRFSISGVGGGGSDGLSTSGAVGGLQIGYNYQIQNVVVGVENDFNWSSAKGRHSPVFGIPNIEHRAELDFFGTVRGRLGYAFDRFLPYVTGGVAYGDVRNVYDSTLGLGSFARGGNSIGWTIGGGLEYAVDAHWSVKAEYLYLQFPDVTTNFLGAQLKYEDSAQFARAGINYRF